MPRALSTSTRPGQPPWATHPRTSRPQPRIHRRADRLCRTQQVDAAVTPRHALHLAVRAQSHLSGVTMRLAAARRARVASPNAGTVVFAIAAEGELARGLPGPGPRPSWTRHSP